MDFEKSRHDRAIDLFSSITGVKDEATFHFNCLSEAEKARYYVCADDIYAAATDCYRDGISQSIDIVAEECTTLKEFTLSKRLESALSTFQSLVIGPIRAVMQSTTEDGSTWHCDVDTNPLPIDKEQTGEYDYESNVKASGKQSNLNDFTQKLYKSFAAKSSKRGAFIPISNYAYKELQQESMKPECLNTKKKKKTI